MNIVHVASEVTPWSQSGGLAEVVAALPRAQRAAGDRAIVVSPLHRSVRERCARRSLELTDLGMAMDVALGSSSLRVGVHCIEAADGEDIYFIDAPSLYDRHGLYADEHNRDYDDNARRFGVLTKVAGQVAHHVFGGDPDVVHAHDWQSGLALLWAPSSATRVLTIHNLAYQGVFPKQFMDELGLDWELFTSDQLEFYDQLSFLKAGIAFADVVTTVSPSYAREITTSEFGHNLDGFLRYHARQLTGIVNGIDTSVWDPEADRHLASHFGAHDLSGKRACRSAVANEFGVEVGNGELLCGVVSRFAWQKGLDLVAEVAPQLAGMGIRVLVLGTGDPELEQTFRDMDADPSCPVHAKIDFDVGLAHRILAGCDATIMPSRFEPCGLNQLYAMRYGTLPVVHAVGGLRDTVIDSGDDALLAGQGTGFRFEHADANGLAWALARAARLFGETGAWQAIVRNAMARDSSWTASAAEYRALYQNATARG